MTDLNNSRRENLRRLWEDETNEEWTQAWRQDLTAEERKYVDILDHGYSLGIRRLCESILIRDKIRQQFNPRSIEAIITLRDCCKLRLKDGRAFLVRLSRDNNLKFRAIDAVGQGG